MSGTCTDSQNNCNEGNYCPTGTTTEKVCITCTEGCLTCSGTTLEDTMCATCADGQFLDGKKCSSCDSKCKICSTTATTCSVCENDNFLENNACKTCTANQMKPCVCTAAVNCTTCASDKTKCATCNGNYNQDAATPCSTCNPGFFESTTVPKTCTACPATCLTCTSATECQTCANVNVLVGSTCAPCQIAQMKPCVCTDAVNCATCATDNTKCATCNGNYNQDADTPCSTCKPTFFEDTTAGTKTCKACSANCITCSSDTNCTVCDSGFVVEANKCEKCADLNCTTCQTGKNVCTACTTGFTLTDSKCVKNCSEDSECAPSEICQTTCKTCTDNCATCKNTLSECKSCLSGFILEGTTCTQCGDNCANCDGDKAVCRLCKRNFFLQTGACTTCAGNTVEQCECNEAINCAACQVADTTKCENCLTGYKKSNLGSCDECSEGFFMSQKLCSKCGDVCKSCSGNGERCDTCATGHTMSINQICEKDCTDVVTDGMVCVVEQVVACGSDGQTVACKCQTAVNCLKCNGTDRKNASPACQDTRLRKRSALGALRELKLLVRSALFLEIGLKITFLAELLPALQLQF
ncbi:Cysteine-rich protein [Spironucleus salmonicida]|uniref:Cysteine-rich protein n=1 Tax=Spironucleus salmonicida TaxID=348837 RepID=V6LMG1_9EUKA|nr:Cysteine-rich protein [Spironucleus salmonicida]|eukprot:EST45403.1 Cysteine-rich protein [Spironucleus salmonicida]